MRTESEHQWIKESDDILTLPKNVGNMSEIIFQEINQEIKKQIDDIEYDGKFLRRSKTIIFPRNCCSERSPTDGIGFLWERQNESIGCVVKKPE